MFTYKKGFEGKIVILNLGNNYSIFYNPRKQFKCKLIQTTKTGYNFLNLDTNKSMLKNYLYVSKKLDIFNNGNVFWITRILQIKPIYDESK